MSIETAYKAVTNDYKSIGRDAWEGNVGSHAFPDDIWADLQLTYTIGTTVAPDPTDELATKMSWPVLAAREAAAAAGRRPWQPNGTAGIYAYAFRDGQLLTPAYTAGASQWIPGITSPPSAHAALLPSRILELEYDTADQVNPPLYMGGGGANQIQVTSVNVIGLWTP